jgi:hypothetical protein
MKRSKRLLFLSEKLNGNFGKKMYIIDKFNAKITFFNSRAFVKDVLYIRTEVVYHYIYS